MTGDFQSSHNKVAGSILASTLVFLIGALGIAVVTAAGGGDPVWTLIVVGGAVVIFLLLSWLLKQASITSARACYSWVFSKNARPQADYEPRKRTQRGKRYGEQRPASADDVRDLKDDARNWIPSNTKAGRTRKR